MLFHVVGTLADGAVFSIQIEGGKRNDSGLQIDISEAAASGMRQSIGLW